MIYNVTPADNNIVLQDIDTYNYVLNDTGVKTTYLSNKINDLLQFHNQ